MVVIIKGYHFSGRIKTLRIYNGWYFLRIKGHTTSIYYITDAGYELYLTVPTYVVIRLTNKFRNSGIVCILSCVPSQSYSTHGAVQGGLIVHDFEAFSWKRLQIYNFPVHHMNNASL